jgi:hypothetical protein
MNQSGAEKSHEFLATHVDALEQLLKKPHEPP